MTYKVIHILGALVPGGAELSLLRILSDWKDKDFTFSILYTREFDQLKPSFTNIGVSATHLGWKNERDLGQIPMMIKLFRKERPHIVHTHLWTGNYWVVFAAKLAGVPVIIETVHRISNHSGLAFLAHRILRSTLKMLIDASVSVSNKVKTHLQAVYRFSLKNNPVIYNGLNLNNVIDHEFSAGLSRKLNLNQDVPILIVVGNLRPVKGYDILMNAVNILSNKLKMNFHVVIVGGILPEIPDYIDSLKSLIDKFSINNHISFLGFQKNVNEFICASDLLIVPSYIEGGPVVVLEAMRAGIPVIATRTGAVPEYVIDGETGLIVEPGDSAALADAIEYMLQHPEKWHDMGERGRERFKNNFTIDKTVEQLTNLYKSLLRKKGLLDKS